MYIPDIQYHIAIALSKVFINGLPYIIGQAIYIFILWFLLSSSSFFLA